MTDYTEENNDLVSPQQNIDEMDSVTGLPSVSPESDVKDNTLSVEDDVPSTKESSESEAVFHEKILGMLDGLQKNGGQIYQQFGQVTTHNKPLLDKFLDVMSGRIEKKTQKLGEEMSSVKEQLLTHLSTLQSQSQQIDNQIREIADANKDKLLDLEKVFKAKFAKIVWECLFSIEEYSGNNVIEKIECDANGCEKLKELCRNIKSDIKMMLEQDFGTKTFADPEETTLLDNQRHQVNRGVWEKTDDSEKHRKISRTFCYGVEDIEGKIIFRQRVAAYDYRTPEEQPAQSQTNNPPNQPGEQ